jgi:NAD(P)-dependent dehydrogenase (short-subunit alcohol dehydrogenase family)
MKYAIVTGGASGLGLGIVRALLADVIDRALVPAPADLADSVEGFNGDVTDEAQINAVVDASTAKFGPHPDVLCNNAGGRESGWFERECSAERNAISNSAQNTSTAVTKLAQVPRYSHRL